MMLICCDDGITDVGIALEKTCEVIVGVTL